MARQVVATQPPSRIPRRLRASVAFLAIAVLLPMVVLGAAMATSTDLPPLPAEPAVPPMPDAASVNRVDEDVASVRWLPRLGGSERRAAAIYETLEPDDGKALDDMLQAALDDLATADSRSAVDELGSALVDGVVADGADDLAELDDKIVAVLEVIPGSATDADNLNDLAVALFLLGGTSETNNDTQVKLGAIRLLAAAAERFSDHPDLAVNLAFFRSLVRPDLVDPDEMVTGLTGFVDTHPDDVTARLLLASLQARRWDRDGLADALATLDPLLDRPERSSIGRLAVGDAYVANIDRWSEVQPERSRQLVNLAIESYDAVLAEGGLAAAFAGRAVALDLMGETTLALESMRAAVDRNADSATRLVQVARLEGCTDDLAASRDSARRALDLAGRGRSRMNAARLVLSGAPASLGVDRGFGGISLGSGRPAHALEPSLGDTTGGGYVEDPFDPSGPRPCLGAEAVAPAPAARELVIDVSISLGDPAAIEASEGFDLEGDAFAAGLVAGNPLPDGERVNEILRAATHMAPARAAAMCRELFSTAASDYDAPAILACVVRGSSRAGSPDDVVWGLERLTPLLSSRDDAEGSEALLEGVEMLLSVGRADDAERFLKIATRVPVVDSAALIRLGDVRQGSNDARGAVVLYDLAIAFADADTTVVHADAERYAPMRLRRLAQVARNNRGTATLDALRESDSAAPDCSAVADACQRVADDFAAAAESDSGNWVYQWNAGWVARLMGATASAEAALTRAIELGPRNSRALNDLAILQARRGAIEDARHLLLMALAADDAFDLAAWNLGVLETRSPSTLLSGQRLLALAIGRNPTLRSEPLVFRFDEQVVRIAADEDGRLAIDRVTAGPAVAGIAFAAVAAVGSLAQLFSAVRGDVQGTVAGVVESRFGRSLRRWRLGGRAKVALKRRRVVWRTWFTWVPVLAVLIVTTVVAAGSGARDAAAGGLLLALLTTTAALLTHAAGHAMVMSNATRLRPARWDRGYALAVVGLAFAVPAGPYPAERIVDRDERRAWWTSLAGPLANLTAAAIALMLGLLAPLPVLRTLAAVNLAVAAYALIPAGPLDGARLAARRPDVVAVIALVVAIVSTGLALGIV